MNIHIELVKKWLDDNDSVSQQELENNAYAAGYAANAAYAAHADAAYAAANAAVNAAAHADAAYWVKRYEELEKE
jgi:hypothetical protein